VLGDPPTLDSHWTTANFVEVITQHIYESFYTLDQNYQPIPVLAEARPAVSADGFTYTIKLRIGGSAKYVKGLLAPRDPAALARR